MSFNKRFNNSVPVAKAIPIPSNMAGKSNVPILRARSVRKVKGFLTMENWLMMAKLFVLLGLVVFIITAFTNAQNGIIISYSLIGVGIITSLFVMSIYSTYQVRATGNILNILKIVKVMYPFVLLTIIIGACIGFLIYIFSIIEPILDRNQGKLPPTIYAINYTTFIFTLIQCYILFKYYDSIIKKVNIESTQKWIYLAGFTLASVFTMAMSGQLFVFVTRFITDG